MFYTLGVLLALNGTPSADDYTPRPPERFERVQDQDRRDWLRRCYASCAHWRQRGNEWQYQRCRQDCREGR